MPIASPLKLAVNRQIHNAAQHPVELDWNQANAVDARIELDLRIGASFTRLQTKRLQTAFNQLKDVMSYGKAVAILSLLLPNDQPQFDLVRTMSISHSRLCCGTVQEGEVVPPRTLLVHLPVAGCPRLRRRRGTFHVEKRSYLSPSLRGFSLHTCDGF